MRIMSRFVLAATLAGLAGCAAAADAPSNKEKDKSSDRALIGGQEAGATGFPAALMINDGQSLCTAAKVGPRHILTAAHCVHDSTANTVRTSYGPGSTIYVTNMKEVDPTQMKPVVVYGTYIFPTWQLDCQAPCSVNVLGSDVPPDVAVIVLDQDTDFPSAFVDMTPVAEGDPLVIMGYGCEVSVNGPAPSVRTLKTQATVAIPGSSLDHPNSSIPPSDPRFPSLLASYFLTPGQAMTGDAASLCPGDSGGPVFRNDALQNTVTGINAYYSFDASGVSVTNWHTRVDAQSRFAIGPWLAALGVQTIDSTGTAACGGLVNTTCIGDLLVGCDGSNLTWNECQQTGAHCGTDPTTQAVGCIGGASGGATDVSSSTDGSSTASTGGADACNGITFEGTCVGDTVEWCEGGALQQMDCPVSCGWDDENGFYNCV